MDSGSKNTSHNPTFYADDFSGPYSDHLQQSHQVVESVLPTKDAVNCFSSTSSSNGEWEKISNFDNSFLDSDHEIGFLDQGASNPIASCLVNGKRTCLNSNPCRLHSQEFRSRANNSLNQQNNSLFGSLYLSTFNGVDKLVNLGKRGIELAFDTTFNAPRLKNFVNMPVSTNNSITEPGFSALRPSSNNSFSTSNSNDPVIVSPSTETIPDFHSRNIVSHSPVFNPLNIPSNDFHFHKNSQTHTIHNPKITVNAQSSQELPFFSSEGNTAINTNQTNSRKGPNSLNSLSKKNSVEATLISKPKKNHPNGSGSPIKACVMDADYLDSMVLQRYGQSESGRASHSLVNFDSPPESSSFNDPMNGGRSRGDVISEPGCFKKPKNALESLRFIDKDAVHYTRAEFLNFDETADSITGTIKVGNLENVANSENGESFMFPFGKKQHYVNVNPYTYTGTPLIQIYRPSCKKLLEKSLSVTDEDINFPEDSPLNSFHNDENGSECTVNSSPVEIESGLENSGEALNPSGNLQEGRVIQKNINRLRGTYVFNPRPVVPPRSGSNEVYPKDTFADNISEKAENGSETVSGVDIDQFIQLCILSSSSLIK
ncbi:hypothetical protein AYI68_g3338 [Smittium mucronatum]|uniref:Uncharacterized protein n=1 Tax=Smittium mucronatum TaxID=133383 RepID=A0A1R0H067_9FUNG|nr:hypothetical protein AYI68_g3338 [Smittium mucronatum]